MDFVSGGEFFTYMRDNGRIKDEAHARFYVAQIVLALEYLHSRGIAYRDLKVRHACMHGCMLARSAAACMRPGMCCHEAADDCASPAALTPSRMQAQS